MINLPGKSGSSRSTQNRRTPRNRRTRPASTSEGRDQLLNVKIRARHESRKRRRNLFGILFKTTFVLSILLALGLGGHWAAKKLFFTNPEYTLEEIDVKIAGRFNREAILHIANVQIGSNIFQLDLDAIQSRLLDVPQIEVAEVQREIPNRLIISITERRPVAWILHNTASGEAHNPETAMLIDPKGVVLRVLDPDPDQFRLPLISGFDISTLESGTQVTLPEVLSALRLLEAVDKAYAETRLRVREIDISRGYGLVVTDQNRTKILMPIEDVDIHLARLNALYTQFTPGNPPATINLMIEKNIPVTFSDGNTDLAGGPLPILEAQPPPRATAVATPAPRRATAAATPRSTPTRPANQANRTASSSPRPAATPVPVMRALPVN